MKEKTDIQNNTYNKKKIIQKNHHKTVNLSFQLLRTFVDNHSRDTFAYINLAVYM